jgi:transcriptional regulator with XRE-family HTH domain
MIGLEFICKVYNIENKELAEKLKIVPTNISSWLKGNREIPKKYLNVLSKIFKGLSSEYFQKELTHIDELKIRIHYIETMDFDDRHGEIVVYDPDGEVILDSNEDDYEEQLKNLYIELNKMIKINSYQEKVQFVFETLWAMDFDTKNELFNEKNAEDFIVSKLNSYLDLLKKFRVKDINTIDSIVGYLKNYHGVDRSKWQEQDLFPNEKLLTFYQDLEDVLNKHKVI